MTVSTLSDLAALPSVSSAFANGTDSKSVQVADGITVDFGITASDVGTGLMQALSDIAQFDSGPNGNFAATPNLTSAQNTFLSGEITTSATVSDGINNVVAQNGYVYNRLTDATDQQSSMDTLTRDSFRISRTPTWPAPPPNCRSTRPSFRRRWASPPS